MMNIVMKLSSYILYESEIQVLLTSAKIINLLKLNESKNASEVP